MKALPLWKKLLLVLLSGAVVGFGFLVVLAWHVTHLSRDAARLRDTLVPREERTSTEVQLRGGPLMIGAARWVVNQVDTDPEVAHALAAVRGACVGVYEKTDRAPDPTTWSTADRRMERSGWHRSARVAEADRTVHVYTRSPQRGPLSVCVAIQERSRLVIVSADLEGEGLLAVVREKAARTGLAF